MLLTIPQAAKLLACSTRHVRRLLDQGRIAYVRLGKTGRSDRIVEAELMRFIEDNQCHSIRSAAPGTADSRSRAKSIDDLLGPARAGKPRNLSEDTEEKLRAVVKLVAGHMSKH